MEIDTAIGSDASSFWKVGVANQAAASGVFGTPASRVDDNMDVDQPPVSAEHHQSNFSNATGSGSFTSTQVDSAPAVTQT